METVDRHKLCFEINSLFIVRSAALADKEMEYEILCHDTEQKTVILLDKIVLIFQSNNSIWVFKREKDL